MATLTAVYCPEGSLDRRIDRAEGQELEYGLERLVEDMKKKGKSDPEIAIKLVDAWYKEQNKPHSWLLKKFESSSEPLDPKYLNQEYWSGKLSSEEYGDDPKFWNSKRAEQTLSGFIPEDLIDRMVLYFLRHTWIKDVFYQYIVDENVPEEEKVLVLQKQVENFVFFSRNKPFGGQWKVNSEPDLLLQNALRDRRDSDSSNDDSNGVAAAPDEESHVTSISGFRFSVQVDKSIPENAGDGPKLDETDMHIFTGVRKHAIEKLGETEVHRLWTMVRGKFKHPSNNASVRCYAFSGHADSRKELHRMPAEWWDQHCDVSLPGGIHVVNVDASQFGHNMVQVLFKVLKPVIKKDLPKIANHVAFGEDEFTEHLILSARQDLNVLHYGLFYDFVVGILNCYDERIKKAIEKGILRLVSKDTAKELVDEKEIWECISVGAKNKKFEPNKTKLEDELSKKDELLKKPELHSKICKIMVSISQTQLSMLKKEIEESPNKYLNKLFLRLQQTQCAEDNAVGSVLRQLLSLNSSKDAFINIRVNFAATDVEHSDKDAVKPFCSVCGHKVMFYSVLPMLLRSIGSSGDDFDKLATLFRKLSAN